MPKKLTIGTITYGKSTLKYLPYFFDSLEKQDFQDFQIIIFDNSEAGEKENREFVREKIQEGSLDISLDFCNENIGFAKAYNKMIDIAEKNDSEYFFVLNPDLILNTSAIREMIDDFEADEELSSLCPRIYHWDFESNKKTEIIDSLGIGMKSGLRFFDIGQGELDSGEFDGVEMLGPSGAAAMYRIKLLEGVKEGGVYFDEFMFMYKEDCDLAYRMFLRGLKTKRSEGAIAYHDRSVKAKGKGFVKIFLNRKNRGRQLKKWSFLNQHIIFCKYWRRQNLRDKISIVFYALKMFFFALIFETYLLKEYSRLFKIGKRIVKY